MENTFLKWAGGKNWFVKNYSDRIPDVFNRYIDPFLGGGSVYFFLEPQRAIISDINQELVTTYMALQNNWMAVERNLRRHARSHNTEYYYYMRSMRPRTDATVAARMIYLNRACFNGIYRVNRSGEFNVPIGTNKEIFTSKMMFQERSVILRDAEIRCCDFENTIDRSENNDFLFCDPPYAVFDENNRFVKYTENTFNWNDQIRLANSLNRAKNRGVKIILTNVNHFTVRNLYENIGGFEIDEITRFSSISGNAEGRRQYSELIISANV